jgi:hypothetical protein
MQISGVSFALTWPCRLCLLRVLLCVSLCYKVSPFQALGKVTLHSLSQACVFIYSSCGRWVFICLLCSFPPTATFTSFPAPDYWAVLLLLPAAMFVYSSHGKWVFPPLLWSFPPSATLTSFPIPGCWARPPLPPEPLLPTRLVYLQFWEGFPSPNLQHSVHPTLFPVCLYCSYCLLVSFSFFPQVEVGLSRGLCCSGPGLSVGVPQNREAHLVCVFPSRLGVGDWQRGRLAAQSTGGPGALLVSLFNVKWRFSAPAGGVEESKLCLFSVIMPAKCVSSISPRFHYRRLSFCFLPLATILVSLIFLNVCIC